MYIYCIYEDLKNKYLEVQYRYDEILREKEWLFEKTQPKSSRADKVVVGTSAGNCFDEYLIAKEEKRIEQRLDEIKTIIIDRETLLSLKETELRHSTSLLDRIYRMYYLDNLTPQKISCVLNYSRSQIYRTLRKIRKNLINAHCH